MLGFITNFVLIVWGNKILRIAHLSGAYWIKIHVNGIYI